MASIQVVANCLQDYQILGLRLTNSNMRSMKVSTHPSTTLETEQFLLISATVCLSRQTGRWSVPIVSL